MNFVSQPQDTALHFSRGQQLELASFPARCLYIKERWSAHQAVGNWRDKKTKLIDETRTEHCAINFSTAFEQEFFDFEFLRQFLENLAQIDSCFSAEKVGNFLRL